MNMNEDMNVVELNDEALEEVSGGRSIRTTGNVNVRRGPGLYYASIGTARKGSTLTYLGSSKRDDRGVTWYKVNYNGYEGWVSSRYSKKV